MYQAVAYQRRNNTVHIWDDELREQEEKDFKNNQ